MKVSAENLNSILDQIQLRWKVGPKHLAGVIGFSRQTIHTWKKVGCPENEYQKLEKFLKKGPDSQISQTSQGAQFTLCLNLKLDLTDPVDENRAKVAEAAKLLETLRKILT